jgi:hypothetical protein
MRKASWALGLTLFVAAVAGAAVLFYFGGYRALLSNDSASLQVELARTQSRAHRDASVVVLGNSTAAEGFLPQWFNTHAGGAKALNLGIASGSMFLFERILLMSMREGVRPQKIILIVTPEIFSLRSDFDYLLNDLTVLKTELEATDIVRLAAHTPRLDTYVDHAARVAARPILFRTELRDLFQHPRERLKEAAALRAWLRGFDARSPMPESSRAFAVCGIGPLSQLPRAIAELRQEKREDTAADYQRVEAGYEVRVHQPLKVDPFEAARFERLLNRLARVAPVYVTAAPYYDPDFDQYPAPYRQNVDQTIREAARRTAGVTLIPDFQAGCGMMTDTVHLNRTGAEQFTQYLLTESSRTRVL